MAGIAVYASGPRSRVADEVDVILTRFHDGHMNRYGFFKNAEGRWTPAGQCRDPEAGGDANAVFNVRAAVRSYFAAFSENEVSRGTVSYWREGDWLAADGLARLKEAVGAIVSMCADSKDVFPDYRTSFEAVTEAVNELYGCIEDGIFTRDSDGSGEAGETALAGSTEGDSAGLQGIAPPSPDPLISKGES